jgi:hypothetical protein
LNHPELGDDPAQVMMRQVIEEGTTDPDDLLQVRIVALRADRGRARAALERARAAVRPAVDISPIVVERFGEAMRERLTTGEIPFRKAYLGSIVDRVEVDDGEIRIVGRKDVLEQAVLANGAPVPGVRSFVRKWRTRKERCRTSYSASLGTGTPISNRKRSIREGRVYDGLPATSELCTARQSAMVDSKWHPITSASPLDGAGLPGLGPVDILRST